MRLVCDDSWDFVYVCLKVSGFFFYWFVLSITFLVLITKYLTKAGTGWKGSLRFEKSIMVEDTVHELKANGYNDRKSESRGLSADGQEGLQPTGGCRPRLHFNMHV